MSQQNVEIVKRLVETWNAGEPDISIYHPAIVYHPRADEPDPSPHVGREAFERLALGFLDAFPNSQFDVEELIDADNLVIAVTVMRGQGQGERC
jgi:SnoaL-like polyketide cyclase